MKICPLKDFEEKLLKKNIITNKEIEQITQNINKEIEEAFQFAKESPFTDKKDLKKYLYN
jgi:TPP-dependent pyruvate/acetoin dehydrogenase alpha subunit